MNWSLDLMEIIIAGVSLFVAGLVLWPPWQEYNYWTNLPDRAGEAGTLATVIVVAVTLGAVAGAVAEIQLPNLVIGGILAYIIGMVGIRIQIHPDSPVHLIFYGVWLICLIIGAAFLTP